MAMLTKAQREEVATMKPFAECVTVYHTKVVVLCINHWEVDEIVVQFDNNPPRLLRLQLEKGPSDWLSSENDDRVYFTARGRRWYLDEFVRYDSPWMGGRV